MSRACVHLQLCLLLAVLVGCKDDSGGPEAMSRPVSFVVLSTTQPRPVNRLTGSAESWKREDLGFEVPGRVVRVVEPGANVVGRAFNDQGEVVNQGTVLAEIDTERYEIALKQAQAAADAARTDLEQVIPQQLAEAKATLTLADKELLRYRNLVASESASQQELDVRETAQTAASAKVAQVEALRATKVSLLETALAQVEQAKVNIKDCRLFSPFNSQVARVSIIPGGYVLPGQPVLTVQMMDPMKVDIAVSPETDARVNHNDLVRITTPNGERLEGYVYLKDTFADPATRTFLITLLVRNRQIEVGVPESMQGEPIARCRNLWKLDKPVVDGPGNFFIEEGAIQQDDKGHFVWKVENLTVQQLFDDFDPVLTVRKARVQVGEGRVPVLQVFTFRELTDIGDLDPMKDVVASRIVGDVEDGGRMVLVRDRWALRPGDVVRVDLRGADAQEGFYVPEDAIQSDGTRSYVAVAGEESQGSSKVKFVTVNPLETVGQLQRIEATEEGALKDGSKVIVDGAHYVAEGDLVRPVKESTLTP